VRELNSVPDFSTVLTRKATGRLPLFSYDDSPSPRETGAIEKPPIELDTGAVYTG
jgi:hypothetical protein